MFQLIANINSRETPYYAAVFVMCVCLIAVPILLFTSRKRIFHEADYPWQRIGVLVMASFFLLFFRNWYSGARIYESTHPGTTLVSWTIGMLLFAMGTELMIVLAHRGKIVDSACLRKLEWIWKNILPFQYVIGGSLMVYMTLFS